VPSKTGERTGVPRSVTGLRNRVDGNFLTLALLGVLTGASLGTLGDGRVTVPLVGDVPGVVVGSLGLLVAGVLYTQLDTCTCSGDTACACGDDCGDRCTVDN
jgi:hypothetical protein